MDSAAETRAVFPAVVASVDAEGFAEAKVAWSNYVRVRLTRPTNIGERIGVAILEPDGRMMQVDQPDAKLSKAAEYVRDNEGYEDNSAGWKCAERGELPPPDEPDHDFIAYAKTVAAAWLEEHKSP